MHILKTACRAALLCGAMMSAGPAISPALAETNNIKIANQYSMAHLPLMIMKEQGMVEKQLKAQGLDDTKVTYINLAGSSAMIDGLLSDSLQVASTGTTGFAVLWDRTQGEVKAIGGQALTPTLLVTRDPKVKTIKDLTLQNRIAVPAVGVSPQAIFLKLAAFKEYGKGKSDHFDKMTVTMAHPDAYAAMLSGQSGIDTHFSPPPFPQWEVDRIPGARVILNSDDLLGGPSTTTVMISTEKFRNANPKTVAAISAALREATDFINENPRAAAEIYLRALNNTKDSVDDTVKELTGPGMEFTAVPKATVKLFSAMNDIGALKRKPNDWKELFFPEAHDLDGN